MQIGLLETILRISDELPRRKRRGITSNFDQGRRKPSITGKYNSLFPRSGTTGLTAYGPSGQHSKLAR